MRLLTYLEWADVLRLSVRAAAMGQRELMTGACIAVDGAGGSGKSTIARRLGRVAPDFQVISLDEFYRPRAERYRGAIGQRPIGADYDLARLRQEVLEPFVRGAPAAYRRYDWHADRLGSERIAVAAPIVVLEGVYAMSVALAPLIAVAVWVECARELRLARGLARDGEGARQRWEGDWMPGEDLYIETEHPRRRAAFVCDGSREDLAERVGLIEHE